MLFASICEKYKAGVNRWESINGPSNSFNHGILTSVKDASSTLIGYDPYVKVHVVCSRADALQLPTSYHILRHTHADQRPCTRTPKSIYILLGPLGISAHSTVWYNNALLFARPLRTRRLMRKQTCCSSDCPVHVGIMHM